MTDFSKDIKNFKEYGTYTYKFDGVGNMIFNNSSTDFSQVYLALPLVNTNYNSKTGSFYTQAFEEFIPPMVVTSSITNEELQNQLETVQTENTDLKSQLDVLITQSGVSSPVDDVLATKQVILELRKSLGQGRIDADFSSDFPYTPILKAP